MIYNWRGFAVVTSSSSVLIIQFAGTFPLLFFRVVITLQHNQPSYLPLRHDDLPLLEYLSNDVPRGAYSSM